MRNHLIRSLLLAIGMLFLSGASFAQISITVGIAPPPLPVYEQPVCPGEGYIWTPGYWAWDGDDYYWVPGTWVLAPEVGYLWTPPYWGWGGSAFIFHAGYWGPVVGFYGGIDYGFGYFGRGFEGGRWEHDHFYYNREVTNVNVTVIHNVYETKVVRETRENRVSYNGGRGGIEARPTSEEERAEHEHHLAPVAEQTRHVEEARSNREFKHSVNNGRPPIAATSKPAEFNRHENTPARETTRAEGNGHNPAVHPKDLPPAEHRPAPNTGNTKQDQKYEKQQEQLSRKQDQERQKLQQQQEKQHQQYTKQKADAARTQQLEQKHQQQTQQLEQKHTQQQQHLEQKQQPHQTSHQQNAPKEKQH